MPNGRFDMVVYRIHNATTGDSLTRKRSDAAQTALESMTYAAIANHGGLDTHWGHAVMADARRMDWNKGGTVGCARFTIFCTRSH